MNLATFDATYPEFVAVAVSRKNAALAAASVYVDATTFGEAYEHAHGLAAAHLCSLPPGAQQAQRNPKGPPLEGFKLTTHGSQFLELRDGRTSMLRVWPFRST